LCPQSDPKKRYKERKIARGISADWKPQRNHDVDGDSGEHIDGDSGENADGPTMEVIVEALGGGGFATLAGEFIDRKSWPTQM
jgi:hypothetical protein